MFAHRVAGQDSTHARLQGHHACRTRPAVKRHLAEVVARADGAEGDLAAALVGRENLYAALEEDEERFASIAFIAVGGMLMLATLHAHDPITTRVTWNGEIARIVEARCVTCHSPEGRGPMSLATYEDARKWSKAIKEEVMTRRMPYWQAVRGYGDFANDPSLSSFEIALMVAWADGGAPRGDKTPNAPSSSAVPEHERTAREPDSGLKTSTVPCGDRPLPQGTLVAVQPQLQKEDSVGIAVRFPNGQRHIVGWIRHFDPDFPTTYWLRAPLALPPGATLASERQPKQTGNDASRGDCTITVTLTSL